VPVRLTPPCSSPGKTQDKIRTGLRPYDDHCTPRNVFPDSATNHPTQHFRSRFVLGTSSSRHFSTNQTAMKFFLNTFSTRFAGKCSFRTTAMATPKSTDKHCARKTTVQKGVDDKMARTRGRDRILSRGQSQSCLINRTRDLLSVIYSFSWLATFLTIGTKLVKTRQRPLCFLMTTKIVQLCCMTVNQFR
jgi:hypothetical protein